jgi:GNAT superfamily N-acetyltransferase
VDIQSLGFRTDLTIRALEGSLVEARGDHLVIRTPHNPTFWWGNFLLIPELKAGQAAGWLERFAVEFPGAGHTAIGVDSTRSAAIDPAELIASGLEFSSNTVLTASELGPPARPNTEAVCRALDGDDDWRQSWRLREAVSEGMPGSEPEFLRAKLNAERAMTDKGHGSWFGAFLDGELAAQLGVVPDPATGLARYQSVETHPDTRRRGLAGTLVWHAGRAALATGQVKTLVIVAEPTADAIRIYRSAGFAETQDQLSFTGQHAG